MAWLDLDDGIASEFAEAQSQHERRAIHAALRAGQLSVVHGESAPSWPSGRPKQTTDERRAANRAWWRRWHDRVKSGRESAAALALEARARVEMGKFRKLLAKYGSQILFAFPEEKPPSFVAIKHCPGCAGPFAIDRTDWIKRPSEWEVRDGVGIEVRPAEWVLLKKYCSSGCREREKSRNKRERARVAVPADDRPSGVVMVARVSPQVEMWAS